MEARRGHPSLCIFGTVQASRVFDFKLELSKEKAKYSQVGSLGKVAG
jgi:hypothetical protein